MQTLKSLFLLLSIHSLGTTAAVTSRDDVSPYLAERGIEPAQSGSGTIASNKKTYASIYDKNNNPDGLYVPPAPSAQPQALYGLTTQ